jgi:tRNA modification GTPase
VFAPDDTIAAIATPPGRGGIGVVRISGPGASAVATAVLSHRGELEPRRATFTRARTAADTSDEVVAIFFPSPRSYTGQDVIEISAHGSPVVLHGILAGALAAGARLAEPGEFTLRAFLNGKRDLIQSEAVADLVDAVTPLQARVAFDQLEGTLTSRIQRLDEELFDLIARLEASIDFPEEGYHFVHPDEASADIDRVAVAVETLLADARRGRIVREGAQVVIAGRPNVGKSSLFNALVGSDRAIVTAVPGTTRDLVTERVDIHGLAITLVDTAGVRDALDIAEREGVARSDRAREVADLVLLVMDASEPMGDGDLMLLDRTRDARRVVVFNKADLAANHESVSPNALLVSAARLQGIDEVKAAIARELTGSESLRETPLLSNTRHIELLTAAGRDIRQAQRAVAAGTPEEFVLADLQSARQRFDEVVGKRTTDDLLAHIFERFCIGK